MRTPGAPWTAEHETLHPRHTVVLSQELNLCRHRDNFLLPTKERPLATRPRQCEGQGPRRLLAINRAKTTTYSDFSMQVRVLLTFWISSLKQILLLLQSIRFSKDKLYLQCLHFYGI